MFFSRAAQSFPFPAKSPIFNRMLKSYKTTLLGLGCIALGALALWHNWLPNVGAWNNVAYFQNGPEALLIVGIGLLHAKDHDK